MSQLKKNDEVCHWIFNPKNFAGSPLCLNLESQIFFSANSKHPYHISVNSKELSSNFPSSIHTLGYDQAVNITARHKRDGKDTVETYKGYVKTSVEDVENIGNNNHTLNVVSDPMLPENPAHCNITLNYPTELTKPRKSIKNDMAQDLREVFGNEIIEP